MKVLVLIIASEGYPYNSFQHLWRQYMNLDSDFKCYFIKADPTINENYINNDTVFIKCEENYDNVFYKSIETFKMFKDTLYEYDYIFRTNLSSFILFHKYKKWLNTLPKEKVYNGKIAWYGRYMYTSGCGFTCSPDVINIFINSNEKNYIIDDVTFGKICVNNNIKASSAPICEIYLETFDHEINLFNDNEYAFHIRVNSPIRTNDLNLYYTLLNIYYNIFELKE